MKSTFERRDFINTLLFICWKIPGEKESSYYNFGILFFIIGPIQVKAFLPKWKLSIHSHRQMRDGMYPSTARIYLEMLGTDIYMADS